jgi:hypothetical protein
MSSSSKRKVRCEKLGQVEGLPAWSEVVIETLFFPRGEGFDYERGYIFHSVWGGPRWTVLILGWGSEFPAEVTQIERLTEARAYAARVLRQRRSPKAKAAA